MEKRIKYDFNTKTYIEEEYEITPKTGKEIAKERVREIDSELAQIDSEGVTRHLENQVEASGTYDVIYETTRNLIDRKNVLRKERKTLIQKGEM